VKQVFETKRVPWSISGIVIVEIGVDGGGIGTVGRLGGLEQVG
jgi:hypothetical protein